MTVTTNTVGVQMLTIAAALEFYHTHKMQVNRTYTPKNMMKMARLLTGRADLKQRDYLGAARALREAAEARRRPAY
jgi:hypothetical protein